MAGADMSFCDEYRAQGYPEFSIAWRMVCGLQKTEVSKACSGGMMRRFLVLTLGLLSLGAQAQASNTAKIAPELLSGLSGSQRVQVVVQYAPGTNSCNSLLALLGCLTQSVLQLGGTVVQSLPLVNDLVAVLDGNAIATLSNRSDVVYISSDRSIGSLTSDDAVAVNAPLAWQANVTGTGVGVALVDSGVNAHPDFNGTGLLAFSRVAYNQSFVPGQYSPSDAYGHGTHIAGLIAGNGASSTGSMYSNTFKGIAPGARLINLRVLDNNGAATDSTVIAAIHQAIALKGLYNIRVLNLSLGRAVYESYKLDPLCQAVEKAWQNGIVVVVAAGNYGRYVPTDGYATISAPGNDPYVITVGAMKPMGTPNRNDDLIASYSSKGPTLIDHIVKPDLVAPGNLLISTETSNTALYANEPANLVPNFDYIYGGSSQPSKSYFQLSGTSMATGVVSGVVADLLQAHPNLTPDQVKARLMKTAGKTFPSSSSVFDPQTGNTYVSNYDIFTVGAGYVDLGAALNNTDILSGSAVSPTAIYEATTGNVHLLANGSSSWGVNSSWSASAVYGAQRFSSLGSGAWSTSTLGGSSVMWGANTSGGFSAIWSNSVMWGATGDWSSSVMWGASINKGE
jgi:serine protease AprX